MAGLNLEHIMDDLLCPHCHQMFKDPVMLQSCGHNLCRACLHGQQKSGDVKGQGTTCPICKQICPADMFAPNIVLQKLVERFKELEGAEAARQMMTAPQDLSDQLACGLCHKMFRDPVALQTCGHNFCHECLQKGSTSADQGDTICPTCQKKCPKDGYIHNVALANLVNRINPPENEDEEQRTAEGEEEEKEQLHECEEHKEKISLFCLDDQTLCCLVCRDSMKHVRHDFLPLTEASALMRGTFFLDKQVQKMLLMLVINMDKKQKEKIMEHKAEKLRQSEHITNEFEQLRKCINDAEREQRQNLDKIYDPILKKMEENSENLIKIHNNLQENQKEFEKRLLGSHIGILQDIRGFKQRHCKIEGEITMVTDEVAKGLFKGPFQYYTWKKMLSVVQPAASPLTFDPETAHRNLLVSEDLTSVSYKSTFFRRIPNSPKRFSHHPMSLTREGFNAGRHYWEVDVDGNEDWYVGLAQETVNRKQTSNASISDGYWAIFYDIRCGVSVLSEPIICLGIQISPKRVGVYLDYPGGQISFYDAQKMTHILSVTSPFREKLYPYVGTTSTEEVPMKIVHIQL